MCRYSFFYFLMYVFHLFFHSSFSLFPSLFTPWLLLFSYMLYSFSPSILPSLSLSPCFFSSYYLIFPFVPCSFSIPSAFNTTIFSLLLSNLISLSVIIMATNAEAGFGEPIEILQSTSSETVVLESFTLTVGYTSAISVDVSWAPQKDVLEYRIQYRELGECKSYPYIVQYTTSVQ